MTTLSGEITTTAGTRAFIDAMIAHTGDVRAQIEQATAGLADAGITGPALDRLLELTQHYTGARGHWDTLSTALEQHEALTQQARATPGAATDMTFYTDDTGARVAGAGLTTGRDMQDAAAAAAHTDQSSPQKTVQEAHDMTDDAGDKDFQRGEQTNEKRHRFDILGDSASWGRRTSIAEQTAAARRNLLGQLQELTEMLAAGGAAEEGITAAEIIQIRTAALRLAAAADTATDHLGETR